MAQSAAKPQASWSPDSSAPFLVPGETTFSAAALEEIFQERDLARVEEVGGVTALARMLNTDPQTGIHEAESHQEWKDRRVLYGTNGSSQKKTFTRAIFYTWIDKFKDATNVLLAVLATVLLVLGIVPAEILGSSAEERHANWVDALGIYAAVIVAATVQTINQWASDQQWKDLDKSRENFSAKVVRGGVVSMVPKDDILVGDVVLLDAGDRVPADGLFISGYELYVDESELNPESELTRKSSQDPWIRAHSEISEGKGSMLVICTGVRTQYERERAEEEADQEQSRSPDSTNAEELTPLQKRLNRLALDIGKIGITAAAAILAVLVFWWIYDEMWGQPWQWDKLPHLIRIFVMTLTIVVVAIPEGLPMAVTISLSYSVGHMLSDADLVRSNESVETMAAVTTICIDKTGCLTENRPYVDRVFLAGTEFDPNDDYTIKSIKPSVMSIFNDGIALNSTAWVNSEYDRAGSRLECALLEFAEQRLSCKTKELRKSNPIEKVFPFSSARMRMSSLIKKLKATSPMIPTFGNTLPIPGGRQSSFYTPSSGPGYLLYLKGAPELVLARSTRVLKADGSVVAMNNEHRMTYGRKIDEWCARGLRVLGFAIREIPRIKNWNEPPEEDLTLVAMVALIDPVRANANHAIHACRSAGLHTTLVTGDNIITATTVARQVGLLRPGFKTGLQSIKAALRQLDEGINLESVFEDEFVLEGPEFEELDTTELDRVVDRIRVVARASPVDKYRLVERLKSAGEIVAVTGDSPNDEAALRKAEIGLALGTKGSEIAKRASDIVVVDDDITSIMRAVMWGRNIYDNVRKFLQFQLAVSFVVTVTAFIGAVSKYGMPLTAVQMIWINIIMDTMAGLALGSEKPTPTLLNRKPYARRSNLITKAMLRNIILQGLIQCIVILVVLYGGAAIFGLPENGHDYPTKATQHYTMVFTTVIFFTIFHLLNCRRVTEWNVLKRIHANWRFGVIFVVTIVAQIFLVEVCGPFLRTTHLTWSQWLWCAGLGATALPIGFAIRFIPIPYEDFEKSTSDADVKDLDFLAHRSKQEAFSPHFKPLQIASSDADVVV